jgi:hypothetical protein
MLSHLVGSVANVVKGKPSAPPSAPAKSVPELLAALAAVRARRAELEREEQDILATTRLRLREQQEALEALRRQVLDSGIEIEGGHAACAPPVSPSDASVRQPEPSARRGD